jgi:hypothetical protein
MIKIEGIEIEKGAKIIGSRYSAASTESHDLFGFGWLYACPDFFVLTFRERWPSYVLGDVDDTVLNQRVEGELLRGSYGVLHFALHQESSSNLLASGMMTFPCLVRDLQSCDLGPQDQGGAAFLWQVVLAELGGFEMDQSWCLTPFIDGLGDLAWCAIEKQFGFGAYGMGQFLGVLPKQALSSFFDVTDECPVDAGDL